MSEAQREKPLNPTEKAILDELGKLALPHIEASNGRLVLLPLEVCNLDHHIEAQGQPLIDPILIERNATLAESRFPAIQESYNDLAQREIKTALMMGELLKAGNNLIDATNHGEFTDAVFKSAATLSWLGRSGYADMLANNKRGVVVSQIVSRIGLNLDPNYPPLPADQMLTLLYHDVWKSYPNTESQEGLRNLFNETRSNNRKLRRGVRSRLDEGGYYLTMAPSGRKDRPLPGDPNTYLLHALTDRTVEMMTHEKTFTQFSAIWLGREAPVLEFSDMQTGSITHVSIPRRIVNKDEANSAMTNLSATLNRVVPEHHFIYHHIDEELGETALRQFMRRY